MGLATERCSHHDSHVRALPVPHVVEPSRYASDLRLIPVDGSRRVRPPALLTDRVLSESGVRPGAPGRDRRGGKGADHPHHGAGSRAPNERVTIRTGPDDGRGVARRTRAGQLTPEL